ncbi:uncharacterized protein LOC129894636 [Solanum dulcamara]|uniref:uncharacterized protein LOC129894636 n=1 Tax=Solanum dulcamara TaxID=45834 RepID=UPI0024857C7E|nr:uncharacterized protein LOC129894636 [Solanum dulcamara]
MAGEPTTESAQNLNQNHFNIQRGSASSNGQAEWCGKLYSMESVNQTSSVRKKQARFSGWNMQEKMYTEEPWGQWERVNAVVLSWLMNAVLKSLLSGIAFASNALDVWTNLEERFDRVDGSLTYSLHKEIATLQQGTASVAVYNTKLKALWDEFEVLVPSPCCKCEKFRGFVAHMNRQKLYQFLMGLNDSYHQARS